MAIEVGTYLSSLVSANPLSSDAVSQGDNHIRLIKECLANTFPNASRGFRFPSVNAVITGSIFLDETYDNRVIRADPSAGTLTITLPSVASIYEGWSVRVIKVTSNAFAVKVSGSGGSLIRGYSDFFLFDHYEGAVFTYLGSSGWVVSLDIADPLGKIEWWPLPTLPGKYIKANGAALSRTTYVELNALYSSQNYPYGDGDGTITFNVPDWRGRFIRVVDDGSGIDPDAASRTTRGDDAVTTGDAVGTKQDHEIDAHTHTQQGTFNTNGSGNHTHGINNAANQLNDINSSGSTSVAGANSGDTDPGGNHTHTVTLSGQTASRGGNETRPVNIYSYAIIRAWR